MTWIIGRPGPFGYAVGLSDIRVTLPDGTERDCLQKIYKVGDHIAIGFAGSVAMGLEAVNQLAADLAAFPRPPKKGSALLPEAIAKVLSLGTPKIFENFPEDVRRLGLQLILLSAHPEEKDGAAPWAKCYVYRFSWPYFQPQLAGPSEIVSIGSGNAVEAYKHALRQLQTDFEHLQLQQFHRHGAALGMMTAISAQLKKFPQKGISQHLHICLAGRDGVFIGRNDTRVYDAPEESFKMPPVATNFEELTKMLSADGISSVAEASC